jgi:UPF0716 protein FxsA
MILFRLFLLFTLIPIVEIYILMKMGAIYGVESTLLVVIGTGFLGAYLARREGSHAWQKIQQELTLGRFPGPEIIDGFLILISGVLLLTPGLLTDLAGFFILFPITRHFFKEWIKSKIKKMMQSGQTNITFLI